MSAPATNLSVEQALSQPVEEMLPKADGMPSQNGHADASSSSTAAKTSNGGLSGTVSSESDDLHTKTSEELRLELQQAREERDNFQAQYKGLLGKLTQMRSTLGDRLRQDAEELDRREGQIESLTAEVQTLTETVSTLKSELLSSNDESERVTRELDSLRTSSRAALEEATRAAHEAASKSSTREEEAEERNSREAQIYQLTQTVETLKAQLADWESSYHDEKTRREELDASLQQARLDGQGLNEELRRSREVAELERDNTRNLQMVLEEFQADQDAELQRMLGDYQRKYDTTAAELEEHKDRSRRAEKRSVEYKEAAERAASLEQEVKEKNLLIGKLRHEAVILNEHLTEALKRLHRDSSDDNVDRRLVTNVLLQFLTTPRQDAKRFEMLNLLATILQFTDDEKSTAGITRAASGADTPRKFIGIGASSPRTASGSRSSIGGQEESFSNLFVEFLLSEADKAKTPVSQGPVSPSSAATTSPRTAPAGRLSFDTGNSGVGKNFGSSRRSGSISQMAKSPSREMQSLNLGPSIKEESGNSK